MNTIQSLRAEDEVRTINPLESLCFVHLISFDSFFFPSEQDQKPVGELYLDSISRKKIDEIGNELAHLLPFHQTCSDVYLLPCVVSTEKITQPALGQWEYEAA